MAKKQNNKKPFFKMRLYPDKKSLYYMVYVWKYKKYMMQYLKSTGMKGDCTAVCMSMKCERFNDNGIRLLPFLGEIHFCQTYMPYPVVMHEMGHGAIEWGRRMGHEIKFDYDSTYFGDVTEGEEAILHAQSKMTYEFMVRFYGEKAE